MAYRFSETVDNEAYDVFDEAGALKYQIQRESGVTDNGYIYSQRWVARDIEGNMVDVPDLYRNDLFERLEIR